MDYTKLVLQNNQYNGIAREIQAGSNSHAYLFKSADTDFLEYFCYSVASLFTDSSINRIAKNIHPDVFVYGKTKTDVTQISEIISNLNVAPYEANYKVYILLNAQDLSETCQNKILKSLEEPPKNVIFLLAASSTKKILSTVLSRVKLVEVDGINQDEIYSLLVENGADLAQAKVAVSMCAGNSTLASKLTTQKFLDLYNTCLNMLENLNSSRDCVGFASRLDKKDIDMSEVLDIVISLARDIMMILSGNSNLALNTGNIDKLKLIATKFNLTAATNIISGCLQLKEDLYYNTYSTAVLDNLLLLVAQEKVKCKK